MRILGFLALFAVLCSTVVFGVGLAMPPQKEFNATIGTNFTINIQVINGEGVPGDYSITLEGSLKNRAKVTPSKMRIDPKIEGTIEDGIEGAQITIDSNGLLPGKYSLEVILELGKGDGDFSVVQQISRSITVNYKYPPTLFNKILNFIILKTKQTCNYVLKKISEFYRSNPWINYLIIMIFLGAFFYAGTRVRKILNAIERFIRKLHNEKEKMKAMGILGWLWYWIKNSFKKLRNSLKKKDTPYEKDNSRD